MLHGKKIIAILPAYNASKTLTRTIDAIPRDIVDDIILVDDASTDDTYIVALDLGIDAHRHASNRGYGGNQKTCYARALEKGADIIIMVHPDFQYDPSNIPELIDPIAMGRADAVFGSRMLIKRNAIAGGMPLWKFTANFLLTALENAVLGLRLSEYHSGFRAYSASALDGIAFEENSDGFVFDTEIIIQLALQGKRIYEIPIATRYFPQASMIGFWKSVHYGLAILYSLACYLIHISGIRTYTRFHPLRTQASIYCSTCASHRIRKWLPATCSMEKYFSTESYAISESTNGIHGTIYQCLACDTRFVFSKPFAQQLKTYYKRQVMDDVYLSDEKARRKSFRWILAGIPPAVGPHQTLFDIGCGPGFLLSEAMNMGFTVNGIDSSVASVLYARNHLGIPFVSSGSCELLETSVSDSSQDVITAIDILEHIQDPKKCLTIVRQKLSDTGVFVGTFLMADSWTARLSGSAWHALLPSHLHYYTRRSLEALLASLGFRILSRVAYRRHLSLASLLRRFFHSPGKGLPPLFQKITVPIALDDTLIVYAQKL